MKQTIQSLIGDGLGNASMMRVVVFLIVFSVVASKFWNSYLTHLPVTWDMTDFELIGAALGSKLIQNTQEKTA